MKKRGIILIGLTLVLLVFLTGCFEKSPRTLVRGKIDYMDKRDDWNRNNYCYNSGLIIVNGAYYVVNKVHDEPYKWLRYAYLNNCSVLFEIIHSGNGLDLIEEVDVLECGG